MSHLLISPFMICKIQSTIHIWVPLVRWHFFGKLPDGSVIFWQITRWICYIFWLQLFAAVEVVLVWCPRRLC
jgi:hypothetical protein